MNVERLFSEEPEFETDRLLLRKLSLHDARDYFDFASDPVVSEQTLWDRHETIVDNNFGSIRVMEKLGMRYEGTLRQQLKIKERFIDQKVYSILRDEYFCFS